MSKTSGQLELERLRKRKEITITDYSTCYFCKSTGLTENDKFCPNCAFPQRGTQADMQKYLALFKNKELILEEQKTAINKARNILFALAGLNLLFAILFGLVINNDFPALIIQFIVSMAYLALGFWCMKKPFPAILSGFFVYVVLQVMNAVYDPTTLYKGILWKVIIISAFVYGYKAALQSDKLEKDLASMKKAENFNPDNAV
jgi:hypothetical protein